MQEVIWSTRRRLDDYRGKEEEEDRELLIDKTKEKNKEKPRHKALRDC